MNSPAVLTNEARRWMAPFADELRALYETAWVSLDDAMLATMIQNEFGDRLQAEICIPHSITPNAALLMAKAVARGE